MLIQAFTTGKPKASPGVNEDLIVALPGFGFAVIDGLSDRTGHRYDGLSAGQMAARLVSSEVTNWLVSDSHGAPATLIERITARIAQAYAEHGLSEIAMLEPGRRFGATLALAIDLGKSWRFILVGDSGIRLNGQEVLQRDHPVDVVTSALRRFCYSLACENGADLETAAKVGRAGAFHGGAELHDDMRPWLDAYALGQAVEKARQLAKTQLADVPQSDIDILLNRGIINGQGCFQNNTESPMSYTVLDGTPAPMAHVSIIDRPGSEIKTIEIFSDGYMAPPSGQLIADWEASFALIEAVDPAKIGAYPCPKGSTASHWFDDRTILIVELDQDQSVNRP